VKKAALGRGLDALLGEVGEAYENESSAQNSVVEIPIEDIEPNPYQPRKHFENETLKELADSIKKDGLIQPVVVVEDGLDGYILVAGERRWRASKMAKMGTIKAIVLDITKEQMQQYALIENIQREDLNPIELAQSYEALIKLHDVTHEELASIVHKSRTHITNTLRLLNLSKKAQEALIQKKISAGHAKVLVGLSEKDQTTMVNSIIGQKLSVREVENMIKGIKQPQSTAKKSSKKEQEEEGKQLYLMDLHDKLKKLGIKSVVSSDRITLEFDDQDQIDRFLKRL